MKTDRLRVLVLASTYPRWIDDPEPGFVHELSRRLSAEFDITVIAPHAPGAARREILDGVEILRFRYAPVAWQQLAFNGGILANLRGRPWTWLLVPGFVLSMAWTAARYLRRRNFHVLHAHWLVPQAWIALVVRRLAGRATVPVLATSHGGDLFALRGRIGRLLKRHVLQWADHVTVVSSTMSMEAEKMGAARTKLTVAPMGVDARGEFAPAPTGVRDPATILFVGRLVEKKGVDVLLRAFAEVLKARPDAQLRIVGDGPRRPSLERLATSLGIVSQVNFTGALVHGSLPDVFRRATIFAMPSIEARDGDQEGFGLVLVEAMSCGCPVIASDLRAVRDIVTDGTGLLVRPQDSKALANAIIELLENDVDRELMAAQARDRALESFDWSVAAGRYVDLIGELVGKHA